MWHLQEPDVTTMQLQPGPLLLGNLFARAGYATAHIGKWHVSHAGHAGYGFERLRGGMQVSVCSAKVP
ncbi:hypothetical protein T492DRAFT_133150 [Pavlovales sp. CCMP2436]|nr:hypothetical protein T492DRAFT_133150 [Pavlovales sp. CCMP2436]